MKDVMKGKESNEENRRLSIEIRKKVKENEKGVSCKPFNFKNF